MRGLVKCFAGCNGGINRRAGRSGCAGLFGRVGTVFKLATWQTRLTGARVWPVFYAFRAFLVGEGAGIGPAVPPREAWQDKPKDSARARTQGPLGVPLHVLAIPPSILFFWSNRGV